PRRKGCCRSSQDLFDASRHPLEPVYRYGVIPALISFGITAGLGSTTKDRTRSEIPSRSRFHRSSHWSVVRADKSPSSRRRAVTNSARSLRSAVEALHGESSTWRSTRARSKLSVAGVDPKKLTRARRPSEVIANRWDDLSWARPSHTGGATRRPV